jgi:predicted transcriptional regulator
VKYVVKKWNTAALAGRRNIVVMRVLSRLAIIREEAMYVYASIVAGNM